MCWYMPDMIEKTDMPVNCTIMLNIISIEFLAAYSP